MKIDADVMGTDLRPAYEPPTVTTFDEATVLAKLGPVMLTRSALTTFGTEESGANLDRGPDPHRR